MVCVCGREAFFECVLAKVVVLLGVVGVQRSLVRLSYVRDPVHLVTVVQSVRQLYCVAKMAFQYYLTGFGSAHRPHSVVYIPCVRVG